MTELKSTEEILISMTDEQIVHLLNELMFASHFHAIGFKESQAGIVFNDTAREAKESIEGYARQRDISKRIITSPLFAALRVDLARRNPGVSFPEGWCSWANLEQRQVDRIKEALGTYYAYKYPIYGLITPLGMSKKPNNAREVAQSYGIQGLFVDWDTPYNEIDLEATLRSSRF